MFHEQRQQQTRHIDHLQMVIVAVDPMVLLLLVIHIQATRMISLAMTIIVPLDNDDNIYFYPHVLAFNKDYTYTQIIVQITTLVTHVLLYPCQTLCSTPLTANN